MGYGFETSWELHSAGPRCIPHRACSMLESITVLARHSGAPHSLPIPLNPKPQTRGVLLSALPQSCGPKENPATKASGEPTLNPKP